MNCDFFLNPIIFHMEIVETCRHLKYSVPALGLGFNSLHSTLGSENHIIYYWQGRDSSADEKGTAAAMATTMDEELGGMPVQVSELKLPVELCMYIQLISHGLVS